MDYRSIVIGASWEYYIHWEEVPERSWIDFAVFAGHSSVDCIVNQTGGWGRECVHTHVGDLYIQTRHGSVGCIGVYEQCETSQGCLAEGRTVAKQEATMIVYSRTIIRYQTEYRCGHWSRSPSPKHTLRDYWVVAILFQQLAMQRCGSFPCLSSSPSDVHLPSDRLLGHIHTEHC